MRIKNDTTLLGIEHPIIQAPMAGGITTSELVIASSNHGALGMIGAGYMDPFSLEEQIKEIKQATTKPFGVNIFVPGNMQANQQTIEASKERLSPFYAAYGLDIENIHLPNDISLQNTYEQQLEIVTKQSVPICSFTFGVPSKNIVRHLHEKEITLIGTATSVEEAMMIQNRGMDAVVVQGSEAGGHRGSFCNTTHEPLIGLMSLVPQVADNVNIPIIAAGGLMDGRGVNAALCLGADAVQMGTAFLLTKESGAHTAHKAQIEMMTEEDVILTKAFSGKLARGLTNEFTEYMNEFETVLPPYPIQNTLTQPLRKAAKKDNHAAWMSLWSGQSPRLGKQQTVQELIAHVMHDVNK